MRKREADSILYQPIRSMNVSKEFKTMARVNGYRTFNDLLKTSAHELPGKEKSGYRILREFLDVLQEHDMMDKISDE
jgi:hypothetical protein